MNVRMLSIVCAALLGAADTPKEEAVKKDLAEMKGDWTLVSYTVNGKTTPAAQLAKIHLKVEGNVSTFTVDKDVAHGTYDLDPTKNPKTIDINVTDGPEKGKKKLGVYAFDKGKLLINHGQPGQPRPANLTATATSTLEVWERAKPVAAKPAAKPDAKKPAPPPPPPPPPPAKVAFADKNLEAAIRAELHEPTADLTESNVLNVYFLRAPGKKITNLSGLEKCKNLMELVLTKNQIGDLTPLRELTNLQSLNLADNQIADIHPLAGLTKLQYIEISNNKIERVDILAGMTALNSLYMGGNKIADLAPAAKLTKLWSLSAPHNQIKDIGPVAMLKNISTIDLSDNLISDLTPLGKLVEINLLVLERNKITDLTPLINLVKADAQGEKRIGPFLRLYLGGNPLPELTRTGQLQALKSFGVRIES